MKATDGRYGLCNPGTADWRWQLAGEATPSYPAMRLFRQVRRGDWKAVVMRLCEAVRQRAIQGSAREADKQQ
jgi:hypothetical protein